MRKKKYNKSINLEYKYEDTPESEAALEKVFDKLFSDLIQERKKLVAYFSSEGFKKEYKQLLKKKSVLADYLSIHT